jgi:hypothetical protein
MSARHLLVVSAAAALAVTLATPRTTRAIAFRLPVDNADGQAIWTAMIFGVDHDPTPGADRTDCINYEGRGFPFCYDDHGGTDFLLNGGFATMDAGSAAIVAAADGVVVAAVDGSYDRCHGDLRTQNVTCDGHEMRSNYVTLEHAGGWRTGYHHMRRGSVLVEVGETVRCGDPLGLIGSSGYSTAPHLHFHVYDPRGEVVDPYAGPHSQPESLWVAQHGPRGLPAERCEGDEPPPPADVAQGGADVGEPRKDAGGGDAGGGDAGGGGAGADVVTRPDSATGEDAGAPAADLAGGPDAAGRPDRVGPDAAPGPDAGRGLILLTEGCAAATGAGAGGSGGAPGAAAGLLALAALLLLAARRRPRPAPLPLRRSRRAPRAPLPPE